MSYDVFFGSICVIVGNAIINLHDVRTVYSRMLHMLPYVILLFLCSLGEASSPNKTTSCVAHLSSHHVTWIRINEATRAAFFG
jgi:hypothetical protein